MREFRHDNINTFLGACFVAASPCALFLYCPKGSLQVNKLNFTLVKNALSNISFFIFGFWSFIYNFIYKPFHYKYNYICTLHIYELYFNKFFKKFFMFSNQYGH